MSNRPSKKRSSSAKIQAASRANKSSNMPWFIVGGVVIIAGIALIASIATSSGSSGGDIAGRKAAPAALVTKITTVPDSVFTKIGAGSATPLPQPINGKSIEVDGKPGVLYIGAEFCPFCATERWAMVNALSRFGTFTGLNITNSDPTDTPPAVRTLSFYKSTYKSNYIVFTPVETQNNSRGTLESLTAAQNSISTTYDAPPYVASANTGSIPFIYFNGEYMIAGATYDVSVLEGKSWDQIAAAMSDPSSAVAKGAIGAANGMTAAICLTTKNQPSTTCSLPVIQNLEKQIKAQTPVSSGTTPTTNQNSSSGSK